MKYNERYRKCKYCGTTFDGLKKGQIYCSRACFGKSRQTHVERACSYCGKIFVPKGRANSILCSNECKYKRQSSIMKKYWREIRGESFE